METSNEKCHTGLSDAPSLQGLCWLDAVLLCTQPLAWGPALGLLPDGGGGGAHLDQGADPGHGEATWGASMAPQGCDPVLGKVGLQTGGGAGAPGTRAFPC